MFEKVNPCHPDKVADRIAGALVDAAYRKEENPRIAVEVLIGHGVSHIIAESSVHIPLGEVDAIVKRISRESAHGLCGSAAGRATPLAGNQGRRNPLRRQRHLQGDAGHGGAGKPSARSPKVCITLIPRDGKYIIDEARLILCQSNAPTAELKKLYPTAEVNPLGDWTGGTDVDSGATNRKPRQLTWPIR